MRKIFIIGTTFAALVAGSVAANAQERTVTGAAIGAGAGAAVAGPVGAVVGGAAGAVIGGPRLPHYHCWYDSNGYRHCRHW